MSWDSKISNRKIILASSSPFRKILLERLFLDFTCEVPDIDESRIENESIQSLVVRLANEKAVRIARNYSDGLIIGSDQAAECNELILGKPDNHENAKYQLMKMSGNTVYFYTGLCVFNAKTRVLEQDVVKYSVGFRTLSEKEIDNYLSKEPSFNCVGGFKSEALGISLVNKMQGDDPTALIGLPLIRLCEMLRCQGMYLP